MAKIWYLGHSCLRVEIGGKSIITDPFVNPNPLAKNVDLNTLEADYILVSHGHEDHIADLIALAKQTGALVITNFEIYNWLLKNGVENAHPMNHGGSHSFDGIKVKMVNAIHTSSFPDGTYAGNPAGFVIWSEDKQIYFAGDTALTYDMKLIGEEFDLDLAILPIGDNFTMGYEDAAKAADFVQCKKVLGMHYDTFDPIVIDHDAARSHFSNKGILLELLGIGNNIEV